MKSVLISIRPKWTEKIANGEKTIEVRKSAPQEVPFKAYIYCTIGNGVKGDYLVPSGIQCGKVIGEFICDKVYSIKNRGSSFSVADEEQSVTNEIARQSCLYYDDMVSYFGNKDGFGWHISDLKIYDRPKELSEFYTKKKCNSCKKSGYESTACMYDEDCKVPMSITRAPQSWQYIEDLGEEE